MRRTIVVIICLLALLGARAQDVLPSGCAPGEADVAAPYWEPFQNPAAIGCAESFSAQVGYENKYLSPDLNNCYAALLFHTKYLNIGAAYNFFGNAAYNEMLAAATLGAQFGKVRIGVEVDYFNTFSIAENKYLHTATAQAGVQILLPANTTLGVRVFNPVVSKISYSDIARHLPVLFELGTFTTIKNLDLAFQISYCLYSGVHWNAGAEYQIVDRIAINVGAHGADYIVPSIGARVGFNRFQFRLNCEYDFRIGLCLLSNLKFEL